MKRFGLRSKRLNCDSFAFYFTGFPIALSVVLLAVHGDLIGALLTALVYLAVMFACSMDWSHYA